MRSLFHTQTVEDLHLDADAVIHKVAGTMT